MHTLILFCALLDGIIAGAALDKGVVGLPSRKKIGTSAFANYFRATDLGPGILFYPIVGLAGPILTIIAAVLNYLNSGNVSFTLYISAGFAVLHIIATSQAAPQGLKLRDKTIDEKTVGEILDKFAKWNARRALSLIGAFVFILLAI
jgi:hypothetical protein